MPSDPVTYLLVDGENIDWVLGGILGHKPEPNQRPRWQRLVDFAERRWGNRVRPLFFINATNGELPMSFIQALDAIGYTPLPLAGESDEKVVDVGIQRTLEAISERTGDVLLASHDGDFADHLARLAADDDRRVGILAFEELVSGALRDIDGLERFDLEYDVGALNVELPRLRIIPLSEFRPERYLD